MLLARIQHILTPLAAILLMAATLTSCDKTDTKLHHIYLTSRTDKLAPGDTTQITAHPYPENATAGFPDAPLVWSSADSAIASISQSGLLTALKFGQTSITATFGHLTATKAITITDTAAIANATLLQFLLDQFDTNHNGTLEGYETAPTTGLDLTPLASAAISDTIDLTDLRFFPNLQTLRIERLNVTNLNTPELPALQQLHIDNCYIAQIDLTNNPDITDVRIMACPALQLLSLGSYQQYGANKLRTLQVSRCDVQQLDLSRSAATLWDLAIDNNPRLTSIDLATDTMLHSLTYTCGQTSVSWPLGIELDQITQTCQ